MNVLKYILLLFAILFSFLAASQTPVGLWKTFDDKTGEPKAHIEFFEQEGQYFGKLVTLLHEPEVDSCERCKGEKRDQPLEGLVIIERLRPSKNGRRWRGGTILDPVSGNSYNFSVWFENNNINRLKVRAKHWSGVYRTQTWYKV